MTDEIREPKEYHVVHRETGKVVGKAKSRIRARRILDKKDNDYGSYAHKIVPIHEDAPVNSTGPAVAGTTGEPPGKKAKLMSILRRRKLTESRYGYGKPMTPEQKAASQKSMQDAIDRIKGIKTHSDKPDPKYDEFKKKHDANRKVGDDLMDRIRRDAATRRISEQKLDVKTLTPKQLEKKFNLSTKKIASEIKQGTKVEKEHTTKNKVAKEIALDHLGERPDYYDRLKRIEKGSK